MAATIKRVASSTDCNAELLEALTKYQAAATAAIKRVCSTRSGAGRLERITTTQAPSTYLEPETGTYNTRDPPLLKYVGRPYIAENGSYYGQISNLTGRPKTVHVRGYYRKDGTYVRGHYRSKPRR